MEITTYRTPKNKQSLAELCSLIFIYKALFVLWGPLSCYFPLIQTCKKKKKKKTRRVTHTYMTPPKCNMYTRSKISTQTEIITQKRSNTQPQTPVRHCPYKSHSPVCTHAHI